MLLPVTSRVSKQGRKIVNKSAALGSGQPLLSGSVTLHMEDNYFVSEFHHPQSGGNNDTSIIELLQRFTKEAL